MVILDGLHDKTFNMRSFMTRSNNLCCGCTLLNCFYLIVKAWKSLFVRFHTVHWNIYFVSENN